MSNMLACTFALYQTVLRTGVTVTGFRDVDSDLNEMGVASAFKRTKRDFEPLDIFGTVIDTPFASPEWANVCPADVIAALDEDLFMSEDESSSAEEETVNNQSSCGSIDLNHNIESPLSEAVDKLRRSSGSQSSFSDSSTTDASSCSEEGAVCQIEEVEELERLAKLNASSEQEEASGLNIKLIVSLVQ